MVSEWRVVDGTRIDLVTNDINPWTAKDYIVIESLKGKKMRVFFNELDQVNERIVGVVPVAESYFINKFDKAEQNAVNCLDIKVFNIGKVKNPENHENLMHFYLGECTSMKGVILSPIDWLYTMITENMNKSKSGIEKIGDLTYSIDSCIRNYTYRTVYTIQDVEKFKLWYTKHNILGSN